MCVLCICVYVCLCVYVCMCVLCVCAYVLVRVDKGALWIWVYIMFVSCVSVCVFECILYVRVCHTVGVGGCGCGCARRHACAHVRARSSNLLECEAFTDALAFVCM